MTLQHPVPWRLLASHVIFEHPRLSLVEDTVALPSGQRTEWLRFKDRPDFALVICVDAARRILVARQYCHPPGRVVHEFPGGLAEDGESYLDAARRELLEEVGWYAHRLEEIGSFLSYARRSNVKGHVFVATQLEKRHPAPDNEEFIESEWLDIETFEGKICSGEIENGHMLAAWSLFRLTCSALFRGD